MSKHKKKVLIGSGIAVAVVSAAAAASHRITKELASIAMARPEPKVSEKAASKTTGTNYQSEFSQHRREMSRRLWEKDHVQVELTARGRRTPCGSLVLSGRRKEDYRCNAWLEVFLSR